MANPFKKVAGTLETRCEDSGKHATNAPEPLCFDPRKHASGITETCFGGRESFLRRPSETRFIPGTYCGDLRNPPPPWLSNWNRKRKNAEICWGEGAKISHFRASFRKFWGDPSDQEVEGVIWVNGRGSSTWWTSVSNVNFTGSPEKVWGVCRDLQSESETDHRVGVPAVSFRSKRKDGKLFEKECFRIWEKNRIEDCRNILPCASCFCGEPHYSRYADTVLVTYRGAIQLPEVGRWGWAHKYVGTSDRQIRFAGKTRKWKDWLLRMTRVWEIWISFWVTICLPHLPAFHSFPPSRHLLQFAIFLLVLMPFRPSPNAGRMADLLSPHV